MGEKLFHDPQLSSDGTVVCASCHIVALGGDDGLVKSLGVAGAEGDVNPPSVLNVSLNARQFWNGRALDLREQLQGPIHNPIEMNNNWDLVAERLRSNQDYVKAFADAFNAGITQKNIEDALLSYERTMVRPNSDFDAFIQGDELAFTEPELKGFESFNDLGCVSCHQGANLGGNLYQRLGLFHDYFADKEQIHESDYGLYLVTGDEKDRYKFRVPGLRNVAQTAPYFHDGTSPTLHDAVSKMAYYQLGVSLDVNTVENIVAFLKTLSAEPLNVADSSHQEHGSEAQHDDVHDQEHHQMDEIPPKEHEHEEHHDHARQTQPMKPNLYASHRHMPAENEQ
ncbi:MULTISPECIES: cytochrome-c peroxidase [unclassified Oleiphilus]|uniref:cytochrome-c peroxidase n=1 Tax=unclassified Oleiphilus TaxID=2631174 RepID=UPI0007C2B1D5|nr:MULTISPECIES: cytochrome c peroxidase [unclassified Oleiphilus]KZY68577.1 hypothetical protein A3739_10985 [Oleiphilus sp. HI0067]KZY71311.1 hypothetical protein A3738_14950 [Oleiphilus sp. HI0066]